MRRALLALVGAAGLVLLAGCGASAPASSGSSVSLSSVTSSIPATQKSSAVERASVLDGVTIGIDPGHNGDNHTDTSYIDHPVPNGRGGTETCNTTGTETDGGYTEALYNWRVASDLAALLRHQGAKVVMTRTNNHGIGPCVNRRAQIIDRSHASVAIDIHADGGPASGRGFTVLTPVRSKTNHRVVGASHRYALMLRREFRKTGMPTSDYYGHAGLEPRPDLGGLNLTTVPQVLIECGNMRNATDARLLTSARFQHRAARAIMRAMEDFLRAR